jgi:hypothetical protein
MSPFTYTFHLRFTDSSSESVDDGATIDPLAGWWEGVAIKLLDAPCKATSEATRGSLVALAW